MKVFSHALICSALAAATAAPLYAEVPDTVARVGILSGWRGDDGRHRGAVVVTLAPGWKTYWRAAGEGGIPPVFNWSGSSNLAALDVHFPVPKIFDQNGMRSYGYESQVIFPFYATPSSPGQTIALTGEIELGVCLDICIPVSVTVNGALPADAATTSPEIERAFSDRPRTPSEAGVRDVDCSVEPISDGLRVTASVEMPRLGGDEAVVMEIEDPAIWVSETDVSRDGATLTAIADMVPPSSEPFVMARDAIRITVLGDGAAVEIDGCS